MGGYCAEGKSTRQTLWSIADLRCMNGDLAVMDGSMNGALEVIA